MPIENGYATREAVKVLLEIPDETTTWDDHIDEIINAVSRHIDKETDKTFFTTNGTKTFQAVVEDEVWIPYCTSITTVEVDQGNRSYSTLDPSEWETSEDDPPFDAINTIKTSFPLTRKGVRVTADWGYSSEVPPQIKKATELLAMRLFKRKDAVFGVTSAPAVGSVVIQARIDQDSDIQMLLNDFMEGVFS